MVLKTSVHLLILVSLIFRAKCIWNTPASGDTFRFSVDLVNNYVYFEKIGDTSMYYGTSVLSASDLYYGCEFGSPGEIEYNLDPTTIGILGGGGLTISGNDVISNAAGANTVGSVTVGSSSIYSFQATLIPDTSLDQACTGFYESTWYQLCTTSAVSFTSETYSTCGICDCACATCFGPQPTQCNSCSAGYYQFSTTTCSPCATGCAICSGGGTTQCSDCSNGYYLSSSSCLACATGCAICSSGSNTQCSSCSSGYYLQPSSTTCSNSCPNGYYPDTTANSCPACATGCAICSGGSNTQCSSCSSGYYLQPSSTTCLNSCPSNGYYLNSTSHSCLACLTECTICTGPTDTQCFGCASGYYLQPGASVCLNYCPNGYYASSTLHDCPTCWAQCTICSGSGYTQCSSCSSGHYLQPSSTTCLSTCPNGYYPDSTTHTCPSCATGCAICSGGSNTQCSSCSSGYYLQPSPASTTCLSTCPNGYYPDSTTNSCPSCATECVICSGGSYTQCSSCSSGYYLQPSSTTCLNSCPSNGYYPNSTTQTCLACATGCAICSGGSYTQCSSCSSGYYLQPSSTTCSNCCPNGYYPDSTTNSCPSCATECAICSGGSNTQCSSCSSGYYLQPSSTTCSNSCPSNGYYPDTTANSCPSCATGCAICSGGSNTQSSSCSSGYYLQPSSTTCLSNCPNGYYPDSSAQTCSTCATGCVICSGGSNTQCSSCSSGYYLQPSSTTCSNSCPSNGYYSDSTTHGCPTCATGCAICTGGSNTQCSSCSSGYYLQPSSTICLSTCPNRYFPDSSTQTCSTCATGCVICSGGNNTQCSSCSSGYYLQPSPASTTCLSSCPSGYYTDSANNICLSCTNGCVSCESTATCDVCAQEYYFLPGKTACVTTCPSGLCTYAQNSSCIDCLFDCGNGEQMPYEECDDGNLINGDGCSSVCTVEQNWVCQGGSPTQNNTCTCANTTGVYQFGNSCVVLNSSTQQIVEQIGSYGNTISATTEDSLIGIQLFSGAYGSTFVTALNALHILMLLKYCNVGYPPNVEEFFILTTDNSSSDVTNLLNFFTKLGDNYPQGTATQHRFQKFGVKSFFLSNIGSFFFIIAVLLVIILFLNILKKAIKHPKANSVISDFLLPHFQWNTVLGTIIGAQIKLALAWCLQFSNPLVNTYSIINLVIAVVSILAIIAIYIACIFKISWNWGIVREKLFLGRQALIKAEISQKKLGILWNSYNIGASTGRYFVVLLLLRNTILVAIICLLSNYPLVQGSLLLFISVIYLLIIGVGKPFNSKIDTLTVISNEMCLLLEEIIMTVFATNKRNNFMSLSTGIVVGWVMIGAMLLSLATNILCIILTVITVIVETIRKRREKKAADLKSGDQKKSPRPVHPLEGSKTERSIVIPSNEASSKILPSRISSANEVVNLQDISSQDLISPRGGNWGDIQSNPLKSPRRRYIMDLETPQKRQKR